MSNYIQDSSKTRIMISNPARLTRTGVDGKLFRCPFCEGHEIDTPPEVMRIGSGAPDSTGWQIRVVPNKFNITDIHEVVIHSPDHDRNFEDLDLSQIEKIISVYKERYNFYKDKGQVFIFANQSSTSGASLVHPHSQISIIPQDKETNALPFQPIVNIIEQNESYVAYCPEYSEWAYETWIAQNQVFNFENISDKQVKDLAIILQKMLQKLKKIHATVGNFSKRPFGYNFYISIPQNVIPSRARNLGVEDTVNTKNASLDFSATPRNDELNNWYLRIIPRFIERAGFELSTGLMVNSKPAKEASDELKKI